jgi:hypothetical protein
MNKKCHSIQMVSPFRMEAVVAAFLDRDKIEPPQSVQQYRDESIKKEDCVKEHWMKIWESGDENLGIWR